MTKYNIEEIYNEYFKNRIIDINTKDKYKWASGILSPIYIDNRLIFNYPIFRTMVETSLVNIINDKLKKPTKLVGVATAGIGHASIMSHIMNIPFAYGRSGAKDHGKKNTIEGILSANDEVIIVEDLVSTGQSICNVINSVKDTGAKIIGIISIFSYELPIANESFNKFNIPFHYLIGINDIIKYGKAKELISISDAEIIFDFLNHLRDFKK